MQLGDTEGQILQATESVFLVTKPTNDIHSFGDMIGNMAW